MSARWHKMLRVECIEKWPAKQNRMLWFPLYGRNLFLSIFENDTKKKSFFFSNFRYGKGFNK